MDVDSETDELYHPESIILETPAKIMERSLVLYRAPVIGYLHRLLRCSMKDHGHNLRRRCTSNPRNCDRFLRTQAQESGQMSDVS
ncbi:hypothetical protein AYI69_g1116 [Smittium culicis]|uniref:Uncharacterized protein n=1 Tax=Smittium culicis TaxID=133412 RepID=A0A1R1YR82_9FUNG|nr:hypothetical protein AYI69_g1116 [Smittium culicis]